MLGVVLKEAENGGNREERNIMCPQVQHREVTDSILCCGRGRDGPEVRWMEGDALSDGVLRLTQVKSGGEQLESPDSLLSRCHIATMV